MSSQQIKDLHKLTTRCGHASKKSTSQMIAEILKHRVEAQEHLPPPSKRKREDIDIDMLKQAIQGPMSTNRALLEFYSNHYGLIDRIDKFYYYIFSTANHRTYQKLFFFTFIYYLIFDAFVLYEEHSRDVRYHASRRRLSSVNSLEKNALETFMWKVCQQLGKELQSDE